eukprot:86253_1
MDISPKGFYGEINVLIFLKKLNGNYDLKLSPQELYEFYLYLDSLESTLNGNYKLIQHIFDKVYSETDLFMTNTVSIGNHMSLNLCSEYGVTLFEALCVTMNHLCKKLQFLEETDADEELKEKDDDISETGSIVIHDLNEDKQYIINCALIIWDIIKLLLKYNIKIYHREAHLERISYYPICVLYQSFLILFDHDPFKGDVIDRYIALILKSINCDSMLLQKQGAIDYFMPSILTITGDPGLILCDFWFGGAFPTTTNNSKADAADDTTDLYDGCPSPEMVMNLWFRGFNIVDFCWSSEDIVTEYDYCDMMRHRITNAGDVWSLHVIEQYGHNLVVYLWIFKMMYSVIRHRFIALVSVYLSKSNNERWPDKILHILSEYHLGLEVNTGDNHIWNDEDLTYYAMLHIFDIRSDWKSWIATKILPELSEYNLSLIKSVTSNERFPQIAEKWNNKFISQIYNINSSHFMQYVFVYGGHFTISSMRLLIAINSYNVNYIHYLVSFTNFSHCKSFWALWNNTSLFLGLLNNRNIENDVIEYILYKMQRKYDGENSEYVLNNCCIMQFCHIMTFEANDVIWKRLLWILLKTSKYAKKPPFNKLDVHKYGVPIICSNLDIVKLKYFIKSNLLHPKRLFTDYYIRQLCAKDEDQKDYRKTMKFLIVAFDWIVDKCSNEPQIQTQMHQYLKHANKYRD